jgi:transposase
MRHFVTRLISISSNYIKAGVKLLYLPLYLPDLNPIEDFFAELNDVILIKRN